jgi:hypothetical protein
MELRNDCRAAHRVNWTPNGFNVQIPYKGYTLSLASDGADVFVWDKSNTNWFQVEGTSGESIREAMDWVDNYGHRGVMK